VTREAVGRLIAESREARAEARATRAYSALLHVAVGTLNRRFRVNSNRWVCAYLRHDRARRRPYPSQWSALPWVLIPRATWNGVLELVPSPEASTDEAAPGQPRSRDRLGRNRP
jgi:hypothetical protein